MSPRAGDDGRALSDEHRERVRAWKKANPEKVLAAKKRISEQRRLPWVKT